MVHICVDCTLIQQSEALQSRHDYVLGKSTQVGHPDQKSAVQVQSEGRAQDARLAERLQCMVDMIVNWKESESTVGSNRTK